jgi:Ca2+-binding EF-hand superfamily protein
LTLGLAACAQAQPNGKPATADAPQDFVFLTESRPLLIRVHVRIDGKTLSAAYDDFIGHLFKHLDVKNRGYLTKAEVERAPQLSHMLAGGLSSPFGGFGMGKTDPTPTMDDFDLDKDGKVTPAEVAAYYRKKGFVPFNFKAETETKNSGMMMMALGTTPDAEPTVGEVSEEIFVLLDGKKTGKLTRGTLAAVPKILLRLDANEDEMITARELMAGKPSKKRPSAYDMYMAPPEAVEDKADEPKANPDRPKTKPDLPKTKDDPKAPPSFPKADEQKEPPVPPKKKDLKKTPGMGFDFSSLFQSAPSHPVLMMVAKPGEAPKEMVGSIQKKYRARDAKGLTRQELGLDETTFAALDANRDGFLDAKELAGFVKRAPDLEIMVHLGAPGDAQRGIELRNQNGKPAVLAANVNLIDGLAMLELPKTRVELRGHDEATEDQLAPFLRLQYTVIFKQLDKNGDGYVDAQEAGMGPFNNLLGGAFKAMDRDGDGKISEQEFNDYLDFLADMKARAQKACVSLALSDESRGLFDLLDVNRDGRLSVREMRAAPALIAKLDRAGKGYLTRADLPASYRLTVRRGPAGATSDDYGAVLAAIYGGSSKAETHRAPTAGPLWFRKMDKNGDGDVSRREWLGSEELFRQIDTDGDGLISAAEAERFDALHRKRK